MKEIVKVTFPKRIKIGDLFITIKLVKGEDFRGHLDDELSEMSLRDNMQPSELFTTFIHECLEVITRVQYLSYKCDVDRLIVIKHNQIDNVVIALSEALSQIDIEYKEYK